MKTEEQLKKLGEEISEIDEAMGKLKETKERFLKMKENPDSFVCGWGNYGDEYVFVSVGDTIGTKYGDHGEVTEIDLENNSVKFIDQNGEEDWIGIDRIN